MNNDRFKFRAWNTETKEMIDLHAITPLALDIDPTMLGAGMGVYIPDVEDIIIEQCTGTKGRKDECWQLLFEGDKIHANIIEFSIDTIGHIVWDNEHSWWANKNDAGLTALWRLNLIKIIGTIHDETLKRCGGVECVNIKESTK